MEALAQSQADANTATDAALQENTGTNGKTKSGADEDASAPPSLAFVSQALAAAMAGVQTPAQGQPTTATSAAAVDESTNVISATDGSVSRGALFASLINDADNLKAAPEATHGPKSDASTTPTPSATDNSNATTPFQAHMSVGLHSQHPATDASVGRIDAPVGTAAFNEEIGARVTWIANQGLHCASLQLSPEHLGPLDVRISVQDGSATVSFNAMHADTRAALEQALPRLRDMFATHGLTLTDASVSQQSPRGQAQKQTVAPISSAGRLNDEPNSATLTSVASARLGLVDTYA
jgi:flagellar hook-length control protein FliK